MIQMTQKIFAAFLFIVTILLSPLTIASTSTVEGYRVISVSCTLPKDESVHRFQAIGLLSIDDLGFVKGTFSIQLLKGTEIRSVMQYNDLEVTGTFEQYGPSEDSDEIFNAIELYLDVPYIKNVTLIFKPVPLVSTVMSIDNFNYRSNCTYLE